MSLFAIGIAFVVATLITGYLCHPGTKFYRLDHPNARSLHVNPTPRGGGLGIIVGILVSGVILVALGQGSNVELGWLGVAALLVAAVSLVDDWLSIHFGIRIVVHFTAAGVLVWDGFWLQSITLPGETWELSELVAIGLSLLFTVWMVNLYNFMDGMDGFAGGIAVIGFGTFGLLGWLANAELFSALSLLVAAAAAGFLLFNFPPARIFMGDVGSSFLGFLAASFMLWADRDGVFPLWVGMLVFSPFIVDASVTLVVRVLRRERFWEAHKTHYYQRLVQLGWGHRRTALWEYALMILCAASAVFARQLSPQGQWFIIVMWLVTYLLVMLVVHYLEARRSAVMTR
jgi:UDP-N-acetylmuramyl pentapeptide phosphotransferase/UDP-N-acetylglucosamine-1-phosphate transferase